MHQPLVDLDAAIFQQAIEISDDVVELLDENRTVLYASPSSEDTFGFPPREVTGTPGFERVHPEDLPVVQAEFAAAVAAGRGRLSPYRRRTASGEWRWVKSTAAVLTSAENIRTFLLRSQDITAIRLAGGTATGGTATGATLTGEARRALGSIVESSSDAIVSKGLDGIVTTWNRGAELAFGYSAAEAIGRPMTEMLPAEYLGEAREVMARLERGEAVPNYQTQRICKDGRRITLSLSCSPVRNEAGQVVGASYIARDVTEETEAAAERDRFFTLSLDLLCIVDSKGYFKRVNPAFETILGFSPAELQSMQHVDLLHPDDLAAADEALMELSAGISITNFVNRFRCRDGSYKSISWVTAPYGDVFYAAGHDITDLLQAQQKLEHSLSLLEATLESTADGILVVDEDGSISQYNGKFVEMWGIPREILASGEDARAIEYTHRQLSNPEAFLESTRSLYAADGAEGFDLLQLKDGRVFERFTKTKRLSDTNLSRVWSFRDVTERQRSVNAQMQLNSELEEQRQRLGDILSNVPGLVWETAIDTVSGKQETAYVSSYLETMLGYTVEEWKQSPDLWMESIHPDDRDAALARNRAILDGSGQGVMQYRLLTKRGEVLWTETRCAAIYDTEGRPTGMRGVTMDVSERMLAFEEQSRLAALLESTTDFVCWTDPNCNAQYINPAGRGMLGFSAEESVEGRPLCDFMAGWAQDVILNQAMPEAAATGTWSGETALQAQGGQEIPVSQVVTAHKDAGGSVLFFSTIARDISERKDAEAAMRRYNDELEDQVESRTLQLAESNRELQAQIAERQMAVGALQEVLGFLQEAKDEADKANRAKSEFLSRMSHELRTPLNAILGFGQILEMDDMPPRRKEGVDHILKAGQHLLNLINEVLDISRIEAGKLTLSKEPVPVGRAMREVHDLLRHQAIAEKIDLVVTEPEDPSWHILADRQRLLQVLLNLGSNAVKYNRPGGRATFSAALAQNGASIRISVQDTGAGLSPDDLTKLFTPFERLGAANTQIEGTGIGLALCRRLMDAMDGRIGVDSVPGSGSNFWIELPLTDSPVENVRSQLEAGDLAVSSAEAKRTPMHTVLYIEDNLPNLELIEMLLEERMDVRLLTAMQASTGLALATAHQPGLILLDLHLPDMGGEEVLRRLRANPATQAIPVVVISADATAAQVQSLRDAGAARYLTKPLDVRQFLRVVQENLQDKTPGGPEES